MNTIAHPDPRPTATLAARIAGALQATTLARLALGVVALHVVDDNFLQPEPGTSPAAHLVSGLVPLALLTGAAIAYARPRPGLRATWALLAGFFGLLAGTEALYYTSAVGASGDDYTGLLSIPAGLLLLGLGALTLWTSRKLNARLWWRYSRRLLIAAGALVLGAQVLFPTALAYVVTHTARAEVPAPSETTAARPSDWAAACSINSPPTEKPIPPIRPGSTSGRLLRKSTAAAMSLSPPQPKMFGSPWLAPSPRRSESRTP